MPSASIDTWLQDLRHGLRLLRRNPLFTLTAALSLAIGIGGNTTIFSVAKALLSYRPPGVAQPNNLIDVVDRQSMPGLQHSYPDYLEIRARARTLSDAYAAQIVAEPIGVDVGNGAESVSAKAVTVNYFAVLGVTPAAGRLFTRADSDQPGASPIAVLSDAYWTRRFERNPSVVGRTIRINGRQFTIVGIAPKGFHGTSITAADLWIPIGMLGTTSDAAAAISNREATLFGIGGRLRSGATVQQASAELDAIGRALQGEHANPEQPKRLSAVRASTLPANIALPVSGFLALLTAIVSLVLTIACANLAGALLARGNNRRREMAVRAAIGAARSRLVRQLLTETTLLFVAGATLGLLVARLTIATLIIWMPRLPVAIDLAPALDASVLAFTMVMSLAAALAAGLAPALHAARTNVLSALKEEISGERTSRTRDAFVIAQVCVSVVLVVVAGLLARGLDAAASFDPGFDPLHIELTSLDLSLGHYTKSGEIFAGEFLNRVRRIPGVQSASLASTSQVSDMLRPARITVPDGSTSHDALYGEWGITTPGYFSTMRIHLVDGRDFDFSDGMGGRPVAIVTEGLARTLWPGERAIGKRMLVEQGRPGRAANSASARALEVIGVVTDVNSRSASASAHQLAVYSPLQQEYAPRLTLVIRISDGRSVAQDVRTLLASMDPSLPVVATETLEERMALSLIPQRIAAAVSGSLGAIGLLLAAIGVYAVTAYAVSSRTREIGVRVALGANNKTIVSMVLRHGMVRVLTGSVLGLIFAAGASRLLRGLLSGVSPLDFMTFAAAAAMFAAIGTIACVVPAWRATRIEATDALRCE